MGDIVPTGTQGSPEKDSGAKVEINIPHKPTPIRLPAPQPGGIPQDAPKTSTGSEKKDPENLGAIMEEEFAEKSKAEKATADVPASNVSVVSLEPEIRLLNDNSDLEITLKEKLCEVYVVIDGEQGAEFCTGRAFQKDFRPGSILKLKLFKDISLKPGKKVQLNKVYTIIVTTKKGDGTDGADASKEFVMTKENAENIGIAETHAMLKDILAKHTAIADQNKDIVTKFNELNALALQVAALKKAVDDMPTTKNEYVDSKVIALKKELKGEIDTIRQAMITEDKLSEQLTKSKEETIKALNLDNRFQALSGLITEHQRTGHGGGHQGSGKGSNPLAGDPDVAGKKVSPPPSVDQETQRRDKKKSRLGSITHNLGILILIVVIGGFLGFILLGILTGRSFGDTNRTNDLALLQQESLKKDEEIQKARKAAMDAMENIQNLKQGQENLERKFSNMANSTPTNSAPVTSTNSLGIGTTVVPLVGIKGDGNSVTRDIVTQEILNIYNAPVTYGAPREKVYVLEMDKELYRPQIQEEKVVQEGYYYPNAYSGLRVVKAKKPGTGVRSPKNEPYWSN